MARADQEHEAILAPADALIENGRLSGDTIIARYHGDFQLVPSNQVQFIDVAPAQMVGVSAGLIPFLEHDNANRALMGSNMQRQAVPLLVTEPPLVGTGLEKEAALNSSMLVRAGARASSPASTPITSRLAPTSTSSASSWASTSGPARTRSR